MIEITAAGCGFDLLTIKSRKEMIWMNAADVAKQDEMTEIKYDRWGRMMYHPDFHYNQGKSYSTKELSYICKHYSRGHVKTLSLDVGRTEHSLRQRVNQLRKDGLFDHYKSLMVYDDDLYNPGVGDLGAAVRVDQLDVK